MRSVVRLFASAAFLVGVECSLSAQQSQPASTGKPAAPATDEEKPANTTESLQKATQNPVANLISVPIQNNSNFENNAASVQLYRSIFANDQIGISFRSQQGFF
jgi:hypothetical protein